MISEENLGSPVDCLEIVQIVEQVGWANFRHQFQRENAGKKLAWRAEPPRS